MTRPDRGLPAVAVLAAALCLGAASGALARGQSPPAPPRPPPGGPPRRGAARAQTRGPPAAPPAPSAPIPGAIAAPDIPLEADQLITTLRDIQNRVVAGPATVAIETSLPAMVQRVSDAQLE